ncbi:MAG: branched-chain amino acid ABC transporter permease [Rhodospirillaceae bacterium]
MDPGFLLAQVLGGMASASALFLVAVGLSIIFGVTRVVNFAHGTLFMFGAYLAYTAAVTWGLGFWPAILVATLGTALIGAVVEIGLLRRIYPAPELFQLVATFALVLIGEELVLMIWGPEDLLRPGPDRRGGAAGSADPKLRPVPDRHGTGGVAAALGSVHQNPLGPAGPGGDPGPQHGGRSGL